MIQQDMDLYADELSPLLDSLIILLKREIVVYRELQDAISHEKTILMKPSLERLLESNSKKETVILKAKMLEDGRLKIIKKIAKVLALEENEVTLTVLCSHADHDQREHLQECKSVLSSLIADNWKMNKNNKEIIGFSLSFLQGSVDFIHSLLSATSASYMPSGKMRPVARNGKMIQTEG